MPTYTVITSNLELDESKKKSIAEGIQKFIAKLLEQIHILHKSFLMKLKRIVTLWGAKLLRMNKFILMAK